MKTAAVLWGVLGGMGIGYLAGRYVTPSHPAVSALELNVSPRAATAGAPPYFLAPATSAGSAAEQMARMPPKDRIHELLQLNSSNRRASEMDHYLAGLTKAELPAVLTALQELPSGRVRFQWLGQLFDRWGELDGPGALAVAGQSPARDRWFLESQALQGWVRLDPHGAWATAKTLDADNPSVPSRIGGAFGELARVDLARAFHESTRAPNLAKPMFRELLLEVAAESGKLETVLQNALQMPSAEHREAWINDIFRRWGSADSAAPMSALRSIPDAALARTAMNGLLSGWSELDPQGALDFALENQGDPLVADALGSMLRDTARSLREPEVLDLLDTAKAKGAYDVVAPQLLNQLALHRPELAIELAASLSDENKRDGLIGQALSMWARNDFAAAAAHFESMPVSSAKLEALPGLSWAALQKSEGPATISRWMNSFSDANRVQAAERLVRTLENQQRHAAKPLAPEGVALLAQVISETPNVPADIVERSRTLLSPSVTP